MSATVVLLTCTTPRPVPHSNEAAATSNKMTLPLLQDSAASGNTQPGVGSKQLSPAIEPVHVAQQQTGAGTASDAAAPTADAE